MAVAVPVSLFAVLCAAQPWYALLLLPMVGLPTLNRWWNRADARSKTRVVKTAAIAVLLASVITLVPDPSAQMHDDDAARLPSRAILTLSAVYRGHLACGGVCGEWHGVELTTVAVPPAASRLALDPALSQLGWKRVGGNRLERQYRRVIAQKSAPARRFTLRSRSELALPPDLFASFIPPVLFVPPGPVASSLPSDDPGAAQIVGVDVVLAPTPESVLVLTYPEFAVMATTPSSEPRPLARARHERRVDLTDLVEVADEKVEVELELLSPFARSRPGLEFAGLTGTGWGWLVAVGVLALLTTPVRDRITRVLERMLRFREPEG
jgi:hypothetical protein